MQKKSMTFSQAESSIKEIKEVTKVLGYINVKVARGNFEKTLTDIRSLQKFEANSYELLTRSIELLSWLRKLLSEENRAIEDEDKEYHLKINKIAFLNGLLKNLESILYNGNPKENLDPEANFNFLQAIISVINNALTTSSNGMQGIHSRIRDSIDAICRAIGARYEKEYNALLTICKENWRLEVSRHIKLSNPNSIFAKSIKRNTSGPELCISEVLKTLKKLFVILQAKLEQELVIEKMAIVGNAPLKELKIKAIGKLVAYFDELLNLPYYPDQENLKLLTETKISDMDEYYQTAFHRWREGATSRVETLIQLLLGVVRSKNPGLIDDKAITALSEMRVSFAI